MDLQETIVLRIKRERGSHLATNYGPEGLQRTTHASSERHQWRWWTPSEMVSRLDLVVLDSAAAWINISSTPLGFWEYWGIYRAKRRSEGHPRWAQPTRAPLGLLVRSGGLFPPRDSPWCNLGPISSIWSIENLRKVSWHLDSVWYWFSAM